jgi:DHA1 family bicyclomycin/chloramphenicol resistance-like MFS transporter
MSSISAAADSSDDRHSRLGFVPFVVMMASLQALGALGVDSMLPNLHAIGASFRLQHENQQQLVVTAYLMGFGGAQIVYGALADRFGRRPVLLWGVGLYVGFSALAAFSPSFPLLVGARALQGFGAAAVRVLPISIIRDRFAGRQMARVMSLVSMVFMAVPMMAPALGQGIALVASWRWVFGVLTLVGGFVFLWVALALPETLHPQDRTPIIPARMAHSFLTALRNRTGMGYAAASTFILGALFGFINAGQQVFQDVFHAAGAFPLVFACIAGCMAVASMINARLVERVGMRRMSHGALLAFITLSSIHAAVALSGRETIVVFTILQALTMLSFGLQAGNFNAMAMEPLGHIAGAAASLQGSISMVGGSLIGFVIGQQFNGSAAPIPIGFALCGLGALACVLFAERGRLFRAHAHPA